jgi:hypothetical protein
MNDAGWIAQALRDAGVPTDVGLHVDVADRVLRTLAHTEPPGPARSLFVTTAVCCLIAGSAVAYAAQTWLAASDPLAAVASPVRLALTDG